MPDELAEMAQRYEQYRERNGYNNDRGGRGDRRGGGGGGRGGGMDCLIYNKKFGGYIPRVN